MHTDISAYNNLINIPEPVQHLIYALAFPFDLRCESVTYVYNTCIQLHAYIFILSYTSQKSLLE